MAEPERTHKAQKFTRTLLKTSKTQKPWERPHSKWPPFLSTSDFQSAVGEVFGDIGGELPANFGRRFSSFFWWENRQKHFPPKLHRKFHHQISLRGSGLWRALHFSKATHFDINGCFETNEWGRCSRLPAWASRRGLELRKYGQRTVRESWLSSCKGCEANRTDNSQENFIRSANCRTKVPRIFRIFVPNFAPNFPHFFEDFSCFTFRETETTKNSPPFFNAKSPGKFEKNIHKSFLESRQSKVLGCASAEWIWCGFFGPGKSKSLNRHSLSCVARSF